MLTIFFVYFLSTILLKKRKLYISNIFSQKCNSNIFPLGRHPLVGMLEHFTDKFPDNFFESLISLLPGGEKESILFQCSKLFCDSIKCKLGVHSPETQSNKLHLSNKLPKNRGKKTVTNSHRSVRYMYVQWTARWELDIYSGRKQFNNWKTKWVSTKFMWVVVSCFDRKQNFVFQQWAWPCTYMYTSAHSERDIKLDALGNSIEDIIIPAEPKRNEIKEQIAMVFLLK